MLTRLAIIAAVTVSLIAGVVPAPAQSPRLLPQDGSWRLEVAGKPFLILGGELGNSSADTQRRLMPMPFCRRRRQTISTPC